MSGEQHDVNEALKALSARLERVEARLGMTPVVAPAARSVVSEPPKVVTPPVLPLPVPVMPLNAAPAVPPSVPPIPSAAPPVAPPITKLEELARRKLAAQAASRGEPVIPIAPPVFASVSPPVGSGRPLPLPPTFAAPGPRPVVVSQKFQFERLIGGRLYAIAGALIVVIGLIMLLKLGMDRGWFRLPPELRCIGVAVLGVLMIGGGEYVRRKFGNAGVIAGAGVAGAGIAAIYGSVLAAFGMYSLIGAPVAFGLLALVSAGGVGLSLHAKSLPLAILSLVGAYLNPLCLMAMGAPSGSPLVMPAYLVALLGLGLVLSAWRPRPFRWLRGVTWWGTVILGTLWMVSVGRNNPLVALPFLGLVWVMVHAEMVIGARRVPEGELGAGVSGFFPASFRAVRPMLSSFASTIWAVGIGVLIAEFNRANVPIEGWWVSAAGLAGTSVAGMMLAGHLRAFKDMPETDGERLGVALWTQAASLLITTVALALSDWTQTVAWIAMGVAAIGAGRWVRAKGLEGYGLVLLVISVGRLLTWDSWKAGGAVQQTMGLELSRWSLLMLIGGVSWCVAAWLLHRPSGESDRPSARRRAFVNVCTGIGLTIPFAGLIHPQAQEVSLAGAGIAWGLTVMIASRVLGSAVLRYWGMAATMVVTVVCGLVLLADGHARAWTCAAGPLVLSDWSFVMMAVGAAWVANAWLVRTKESATAEAGSNAAIGLAAASLMSAFLAKGTSIGAVCMVWLGIGIILVALHQRLRGRGLDVMGLVVLVVTMMLWAVEFLVEQVWLKATMPGLRHPGLWVALAIVAAMVGATAWLRRGRPMRATFAPMIPIVQAIAGVLLLGSTSLEVARSAGVWFPADHTSQAASLTIWWAVFAVGMLIAGFVASVPIIRHLGLALLGVAAVKALIVDMASVAAEWRVASFIGVGLLMLGVAVGYAKVSSKLDKAARKEAEEPGGDGGAV